MLTKLARPKLILALGSLGFLGLLVISIIEGVSGQIRLIETAKSILMLLLVAAVFLGLHWISTILRKLVITLNVTKDVVFETSEVVGSMNENLPKSRDWRSFVAFETQKSLEPIKTELIRVRSNLVQVGSELANSINGDPHLSISSHPALGITSGEKSLAESERTRMHDSNVDAKQIEMMVPVDFERTEFNDERYKGSVRLLVLSDELGNFDPIVLTKKGVTFEEVVSGGDFVEIQFAITPSSDGGSAKAGLIWAQAVDEYDKPLEFLLLQNPNPQLGSYKYLDNRSASIQKHSFNMPLSAKKLRYGFKAWDHEICLQNGFQFSHFGMDDTWKKNRKAKDVRVAVILDEFSFNSFAPEFDVVEISPGNWREEFEKTKPDLFFCESAWSGRDSLTRPWKGKVYASSNFKHENRTLLLEILEYCRIHQIPTVFWNKEDPSHYDDQIHNFVKTALLFDHIFTTDKETVLRYQLEHGHPSVHALPFAVQPRIFNPLGSRGERSTDVVFAGSWYANHRHRSQEMEDIFDQIIANGIGLKIYDRYYGTEDPLHFFPERFRPFCNPPVSHAEIGRVYRESVFGLTINTETKSPTMFARRVFELMACNTYVLSNYSVGLAQFFGDDVYFFDKKKDVGIPWDRNTIDAARRRNLNKVLRSHTYKKRVEQIFDVAGIQFSPDDELINIACRIDNVEDVERAIEYLFKNQRGTASMSLIVGSSIEPLGHSNIFRRFNKNGITVISEKQLLNDEIDLSNWLSGSGYLYFADFAQPLPDAKDLEELTLHTQYTEFPVGRADKEPSLQIRRRDSLSSTLVLKSALKSILENFSHKNHCFVYEI